MEEQSSRLSISEQDDVIVAVLMDKKILDEASIAQIGEELKAMVAEAAGIRLVLDFANVGHMSSSALGMLITLHKRVAERGGQLLLCNIRSSIYEVFTITRLNEVFQIHPNRREAVSAASP